MCYPKEGGGIGFKSLHAVSKALCAKLWWNFSHYLYGVTSCGTNIAKNFTLLWQEDMVFLIYGGK